MAKHLEMMIIPAARRREHFRNCYTIELGRVHATGVCSWPVERLPEMIDRVMTGLETRRVPSGPAFDATMKYFGLKTQKALFAFLEY